MDATAQSGSGSGSGYHERVQQEKRSAILRAATELFLESGYDGTSLARVARVAGVSTATLFKRFPTKAALFDAIVAAHWAVGDHATEPPQPGDPRAGLSTLARRYADLIDRPEMVALFRIVIAEAPRFPELSRRHFALGKLPFFATVQAYLEAEAAAGTLHIDDAELAATHFMGMIATFCFWPRLLLVDYAPTAEAVQRELDEAVRTMLARYGPA
ncbi:MAG TPA: TetR/AcrR family transcriptional regulator [Solirubrobacteraceae bacterium]|nr:TetR/AcrR family transcriptional regulator [Solirubrobacteraceae bacterium]